MENRECLCFDGLFKPNYIYNPSTLNVLFLGFGKSNQSAFKYLIEKNINYFLVRDEHESLKILKDKLYLFDICFRSPGVPSTSELYFLGKLLSKRITNEIDYALTLLNQKKVIMITGSNGKTSLLLLLGKVLSVFNKTHCLGNIGKPILENLKEIHEDDFVLIEASSFVLEDLNNNFELGIIKNIQANHLDSVISKNAYFASKKRLSLFAKKTFTNNDITKYSFDNDYIYDDKKIYLERKKLSRNDPTFIEDIKFCLRVLDYYHLDINLVKDKFSESHIVSYRLQEKKIKNITFVNDSKSTTLASSKYCFDLYKSKRILILGGILKSDFVDFNFNDNDEVYAYGRDRELLKKNYEKTKTFFTLKDVLDSLKLKGFETVIFSPGCSSFDQYNNYIERGQEFDRWVDKWIK